MWEGKEGGASNGLVFSLSGLDAFSQSITTAFDTFVQYRLTQRTFLNGSNPHREKGRPGATTTIKFRLLGLAGLLC